jgi:hypothetical protein
MTENDYVTESIGIIHSELTDLANAHMQGIERGGDPLIEKQIALTSF